MEYRIYDHDDPVGCVLVTREGLFYRLVCTFFPKTTGKFRILLHTNGSMIDLGLCIPSEKGYGLTTRVRIKDINTKNIRFQAMQYGCYPIIKNGEFPFLHKLRYAHLENGEIPVAVYAQEAD